MNTAIVIGGVLVFGVLGLGGLMFVMLIKFLRFMSSPRFDELTGAGRPANRGGFCPNPQCGHANTREDRFCARCGARL